MAELTVINPSHEYVTINQYAQRRGLKSSSPIYKLIKEDLLDVTLIAGKKLLDWTADGDLEFNGPAIQVEKKVRRSNKKSELALLDVVKELKNELKGLREEVKNLGA